ncbi:MAG: hypothetical protein ACRDMV_25265 [Streptosporangiales bacterium]
MNQDEVGRCAQDAISGLIADLTPGAFVTRFVAQVEVVDPDGERGMWMLATPGLHAWDTLGMLEHARAIEWASIAQRDADGEEDR